jgi:hypothetical protein
MERSGVVTKAQIFAGRATNLATIPDLISTTSFMKPLSLALLFVVFGVRANAQTIYTSRAAYDLAHPGNYVIDFNNYTPGPTQYAFVTASTPSGDITFDAIPSSGNIEFLGNNNFSFLGPNNLALYAFNGQFLTDSLSITLPANTFTFGLDLISPSATVPEPYQLTVLSGNTTLATIPSPSVNSGYTFVGFDSSTSPITSVTLQIANGVGNPQPTIDNFTVVPEPSTWLTLLSGGAFLLALSGRRSKQ